jgi:hypothetical protein
MTIDIEALKQKLAKIQASRTGGRGPNVFWKPNEKATVLRAVPYPHAKDPFIEVYWHYDIGGVKSIFCPKMNEGKECPICDLAEKFRSKGTKDDFEIFKQFAPKLRVYLPVVIRGEESQGTKLWGFSQTVEMELIEYIADPDWGDFTHPVSGYDISVRSIPPGKEGNNKPFPRIEHKPKPAKTAFLPKASKEDIKKFVESIPNYFDDEQVFVRKSTSELEDILLRHTSGSVETETDIEEETPPSRGDSVSDDLDAQLDEAFK